MANMILGGTLFGVKANPKNEKEERNMINFDKLLESKRVVVSYADINVDKDFVKGFRKKNNLTQVALANIAGVSKKTVEKWEQGANKVNGSSAVLLTLLDNNPELISQLYSVKTVEGKVEEDSFRPIATESMVVTTQQIKGRAFFPIAAIF